MCELAGADYDGAFLQLDDAELRRRRPHNGSRQAPATRAEHQAPPIFGYVRTAVGADAAQRLATEESFYRDLHDGYRNHFARLGEPQGTVGVAAATAAEAQSGLAAYRALETVVVRGLASANLEAMSAVAQSAAP